MLSPADVKKAKAADRQYRLRDGEGLFLYVRPTGRKLWRYHFEWETRNQSLTLGYYPAMGLDEARAARKAARDYLVRGINPSTAMKLDNALKRVGGGESFEEVAREWHALKKSQWVPVHANDVMESFVIHVFPYTTDVPMRELPAAFLLELVKRIERRPAPETAKRVRQRIAAVFDYAIATNRAEANPASTLGKLLDPRVKRRQPAIRTLEECREMLRAVEAIPASPITRLAMRFLALTAVRPSVVIKAPWIELHGLDQNDPVWVVPPERMKLRKHYKEDDERAHKVPLSRQACDVLRVAHALSSTSPFVFPHDRNKYKGMCENALGYMLNRAGYHRRHVPHGWRASFSTIMNERRPADTKVIDKMLAHVGDDEVEAAYNRSEHMSLRREIAEEWADILLDGFPPAEALLEGFRYDRLGRNPGMNILAPPASGLGT